MPQTPILVKYLWFILTIYSLLCDVTHLYISLYNIKKCAGDRILPHFNAIALA
ncbi:hypothetical protein [Merismopedia glauca]|uniref:hypothetical protein n=1 Tax=Merismopedia glauca TaxID=292586 RepID=UPI0015E779C5|nr:hypothetical protein [Merismopedia glauca]